MSDEKGFLGTLKNLVFEEEPDSAPKDEVSPAPVSPATAAPAPPQAKISPVSTPAPPRDSEHADMCRAILVDLQKSLGTDSPYVLFTDALASLENDVTDEALRYRAAIKVLKLDSSRILTDAQSALGVLEGSCKEKLGKLDEKEANEVSQMEKNYKSIEQQIVDTAAQLQKLQKQKEELGVSIATSRQKISSLRTGLTSAFDDVRTLIAGYVTKLQQYNK